MKEFLFYSYSYQMRMLLDLGEKTAQKKMGYLNKYGFDHKNFNEYNDVVQM